MRCRLLLAVAMLFACGGRADAEDAAPRQDPGGVAALKRLGELVHTPGADGVESMSCRVTALEVASPAPRIELRWTRRSVEVDVRPAPELQPDAAARFVNLLKFKLGLPLLLNAYCDPSRSLAGTRVEAETKAGGLHVSITPPEPDELGKRMRVEFGLTSDGLPATAVYSSVGADGNVAPDKPSFQFALAFVAVGKKAALAEVNGSVPGKPAPRFAIHYMADPAPTAIPRRIDLTSPSGKTESYVLYDFVIDGKPVAGTSRLESLAGRRRRVDAAAQALFDRFDAVIASPHAAGVREARCRVQCRTESIDFIAVPVWTAAGLVECGVTVTAKRGETGEDTAIRRALGALSQWMVRPPSADFADCDARVDAATGRMILESLDPSAAAASATLEFDARGLLVRSTQTLKGGGGDAVVSVRYEPRGDRFVCVEQSMQGVAKSADRFTYYDKPSSPCLVRSIERTVEGGSDAGTYVQTYTDWVLDGRAVPETEAR